MNNFIHQSAYVSDNVLLGKAIHVWHFSQIRDNAKIGSGTVIGANCYIGPGVIIGENCRIQNGVNIYEPAQLGDNVFVGPGTILTNHRHPSALTTDGEPIQKKDWDYDQIIVENNVTIGAGVTCVAPLTIAKNSFIGAGSLLIASTLENGVYFGSPAKFIKFKDA